MVQKDSFSRCLIPNVGNCYGFASTLAAFAKELGYKKIELIDGRTPGTRDHAPDGFTGLRFSKDPANVAR